MSEIKFRPYFSFNALVNAQHKIIKKTHAILFYGHVDILGNQNKNDDLA